MQPPRRPRRWSRRIVSVPLRAVLVVALVAMVAWPEWRWNCDFALGRPESPFGQDGRESENETLRELQSRIRKSTDLQANLMIAFRLQKTDCRIEHTVSRTGDGGTRQRILARDSSLGVIAPR